ncbi:helix-turn-helix domain-containing protein [uncultured Oscillibacter sp.]|jgi:transcriptional regulator with XRE-family HTH domain|uniref:helix-turn-helix domain-containing protein n=1 Tax=uncultured Oscillibacter sp. TaxID=876091 RepID=UPI0025DCB8E9|nr:helix-turn-helix transcriptional regulator [uncultured Oscillibacter sp.]MCI8287840.1 helix-turn-helix transcriptional regulator [Lachnospiraceae bacterium]
MTYDMKSCGERIRRLRLEAGLTQEKAANALNIDQSFYGRIETGKKGCSVDLFVQLSALFGVSLDYLILGRCLCDLPEGTDKKHLITDIKELIERLERLRLSF